MNGSGNRSRGAALLATLLLLLLVAGSLALSIDPRYSARHRVEQTTVTALARARDALLGRAAGDDNRPGSLPCPASDENGQAALFAGNRCPSDIGRFPWRTMKTGELRDGYGELLWYSLSPTLRDHPAAEPINPGTATTISVNGDTGIAALVFSPGPALAGQHGRPGNFVADYLDGSNADGDQTFAETSRNDSFNDRLLPLRSDRLFRIVSLRAIGETAGPAGSPANGLHGYFRVHGTLPWADVDRDGMGDPESASGQLPYGELQLPDWLGRNDWLSRIAYQRLDDARARLSVGTTSVEISMCGTAACT